MTLPREAPTMEETAALLADLGIEADEETAQHYRDAIAEVLTSYETLFGYDYAGPARPDSPRDRLRIPVESPDCDSLNAWTRRFELPGAEDGQLASVTVGVKDNVSVAGVPLSCGSTAFEYVPEIDATIVTRLLDAGVTVVGHTTMDCFAFSGMGDTSDFGQMRNPHDPSRLAGGSSGGSAAAVAADQVDLAIGGDQGGSVRVPASWCGVVGLKPTHGLVPYTGVVRVDNTIDHVGPLARTVEMVARAMAALAGPDGYDPRQRANLSSLMPTFEDYAPVDPDDLTVGVLEEGFQVDGVEDIVEETVRATLDTLADSGATVMPVSVPKHTAAPPVYTPLLVEGAAATMRAGGLGYGFEGYYDVGLAESLNELVDDRLDDLSFNVTAAAAVAAYLTDEEGARAYGRAQNLRGAFAAAYDDALTDIDVLVTPTTPQRALPYDPDAHGFERFVDAVRPSSNTLPFNMTGHPAVSVPCGVADGLPVGLQLVGPQFADDRVLAAAGTVEALTE